MYFTRAIDGDGIATLTFDRPDSSANVFDRPTLEELDAHLSALESHGGLRGVVLASAKSAVFIAGADLHSLARDFSRETLGAIVDLGHRVFTRLQRLPVPSVAAIHGACLGGGCELALACDWRVASTDKSTRIGLPETQLGILPAWGGSVRLPALIGLPAALGLILTGKQLAPISALKTGLVDQLAHPEYLPAAARRLLARGKRPPTPRRFLDRPPFKSLVALQARRTVLAKTRGHYPAPLKAIEVCSAFGLPLAEALAAEKAGFLSLTGTPECRNLMSVFFLQERSKKLAASASASPAAVRRTAVVGAGVMGAGIAQWLSARGLPVLLKDIDPASLARGLRTIANLYRDATSRRSLTATEAQVGFDRITPAHTDVPLAGVDLVIEAAVERLDLKQSLFRQLETRVSPQTVLATNTSALSIAAIASQLAHPERVVGLHFFNPVHRMQLVEIVRGPRTSDATIATAVQFTKAIGKLPVLVHDSPGFLVNRILLPCLVEAVRLFAAGTTPAVIDHLMLDFGMPMGPLRLCDEVGLDVALSVAKDLEQRLPRPVPIDNTLERMLARGWLGKKSGQGFYLHDAKTGRTSPNPAVASIRSAPTAAPGSTETQCDRLVLVMINEAARCLEENVVAAPEDVDFAMMFGTGWAPFRGGPLRHADTLGAAEIVFRLDHLARDVAPHFQPCDRLRAMAAERTAFYPGG